MQVKGFRVAGVHCGLKDGDQRDIALVVSDRPCTATGVFTTNLVKAAPVLYDQEILSRPDPAIRAVLINTGSANACTGEQGLLNTRTSTASVASRLGIQPDGVLALSTGVIGVQLPMEKIETGIAALVERLDPDNWRHAARAIMTTDTQPKLQSVRHDDGYTITGIAKGAGMIAPNMATMLSVIVTDAAVPRDMLQRALDYAAYMSFNRIVVDGDMSTNDTVLVLANGASGVTITDEGAFMQLLADVCAPLAKAIVRDGEGATKFVLVAVDGAPDEATAARVARCIATSALVKTAFYGADPNWGRILAAAGRAGVPLDPNRLSLWLLDKWGQDALQLVKDGEPTDYSERRAIALMKTAEWGVRLDLGQGDEHDYVWTCDISHDYVTINGHYRT